MKKPNKAVLLIVLPVILLSIGVGTYRFFGPAPSPSDTSEIVQGLPVILSQARRMEFVERVGVSGNVEAKHTALVSARIPGVLDDIFVEKGHSVEQGQKLFQTDKIKLSQSMESAEQQVNVAAAAVRAHQATVERVEADLAKVRGDYERYQRLYENQAITTSALETQEAQFKQVQAALREAEAGLELARAQEQQAKSNLAIARKDLDDSLVVSPIRGKVSDRMLEPGEMAGAGTAVFRIDDLRVVELVAYLPEIYYGRVIENSTILQAKVQDTEIGEVVITTKSPTIHPRFRTFEVRALLNDPPANVVPGARADIDVILRKQTGLGVPGRSVLRRGPGQAVFAVQEGKARILTVRTGLEADGWVEVDSEDLTEDMQIVRMGQDRLNDGMAVVEVKEDQE